MSLNFIKSLKFNILTSSHFLEKHKTPLHVSPNQRKLRNFAEKGKTWAFKNTAIKMWLNDIDKIDEKHWHSQRKIVYWNKNCILNKKNNFQIEREQKSHWISINKCVNRWLSGLGVKFLSKQPSNSSSTKHSLLCVSITFRNVMCLKTSYRRHYYKLRWI